MAVDLARYVVSLEAQSAQYVKELDKANKKLDAFHRDQTKAINGVKQAFIGFGQGIVAALSVQAVVRFTAAAIRMADSIGKTAKAAGISATELQKLRFAFGELGGVDAAKTDIGLQRFNRTLGDAVNGSKEAKKTFDALGIALRDSSGNAVKTDVALRQTLKALSEISSSSERAGRASKIFGEELGPKLSASLAGGIKSLEETKEAITGLVSESTVRDAEALTDAFGRLTQSIGSGLSNAIIRATADLAALFGVLDRGVEGQLLRDLDAINDKIATLKAADAAGALGGNIAILEQAIAERERLLRKLKVEQNVTPFAERRALLNGQAVAPPGESSNSGLLAFIERAKQADDITQQMRTSEEKRADAIREANLLYQEGLISLETYRRQLAALSDPDDLLQKNRAAAGLGSGTFQLIPDMAGLEERNRLMIEAERELTEAVRQENAARVDAMHQAWEAQGNAAVAALEHERSLRQSVASEAVGLLSGLAVESKNAARLLIIINQAAAFIRAKQNIAEAVTKALAIDPTGRLAARTAILGKIQLGLIAASGAAQLASVNASGGAPLGTVANPVRTTDSEATKAAAASNRGPQRVVEINIRGGVVTNDAVRSLVRQIREQIDNADVLLFGPGSRQART